MAILGTVAWLDYKEPDKSYTLVNLLMSKICLFGLEYQIMTFMDQFRYLFAPMPMSLCYLKTYFTAGSFQQILMLSTSIVITKYLFTFHVKNPLAIEEGFWSRFIVSWVFLASNLCEIVFYLLPGMSLPCFTKTDYNFFRRLQ